MFNNVAFDIVIGLVFIYLLYSLLATVIAEIIATAIGLRARNLREAIDRMLNDENEEAKGIWSRLWDSFRLTKKPDSPMVNNFYNHPEIKYLGSTGIFRNPSSFKAFSFSKTIIYTLSGEGPADKLKIKERLERLRDKGSEKEAGRIANEEIGRLAEEEIIFDKETAKYVLSLWDESYGDLVKFKLHLEAWFDRTMEQGLEWYKRKIQVVLMVLGFMMAWFFCADTFLIVKNLSTDKDAREKMVQMASAYIESHPRPAELYSTNDTTEEYSKKLDSLLEVKRQLEKDIAKANSVLGLGGWLPDTVRFLSDSLGRGYYVPLVDETVLNYMSKKPVNGKVAFSRGDKWVYFFWLFPLHFFGFLVTAIAISLGAPFWYDLLNKLMKLRTAVKQSTNSSGQNPPAGISPLNREA